MNAQSFHKFGGAKISAPPFNYATIGAIDVFDGAHPRSDNERLGLIFHFPSVAYGNAQTISETFIEQGLCCIIQDEMKEIGKTAPCIRDVDYYCQIIAGEYKGCAVVGMDVGFNEGQSRPEKGSPQAMALATFIQNIKAAIEELKEVQLLQSRDMLNQYATGAVVFDGAEYLSKDTVAGVFGPGLVPAFGFFEASDVTAPENDLYLLIGLRDKKVDTGAITSYVNVRFKEEMDGLCREMRGVAPTRIQAVFRNDVYPQEHGGTVLQLTVRLADGCRDNGSYAIVRNAMRIVANTITPLRNPRNDQRWWGGDPGGNSREKVKGGWLPQLPKVPEWLSGGGKKPAGAFLG